jgi:predicted signal transduction protein with EAL and GGDEF domain
MREADMAMYRAKSSGKSRYEIFDPGMNTHAMERLDLETDLRHAAQRGELVLHYQPLVDLATRTTTALRAHLRWQHPRRGLLDAAAYGPLAEETGLIPDLVHWALRQATQDAAAWQAQLPNMAVHLRLAPRVFDNPDCVDDIKAVLTDARLPAALLSLGCISLSDGAESTLTALREIGVNTTFDDFANVAVPVSQLHRLAIQSLTIDPTTDAAVVASVQSLASSVGVAVLAEEGSPRVLTEVLSPAFPRAA